MNVVLQFCALTLIAQAVDSFERVPRSVGTNCPRNIDFPKGLHCDRPWCVRYRKKGSKAVFKCPRGYDRYGSRYLLCAQDNTWHGDVPLCVKSGCAPIDTSDDVNLVMSIHPKFPDAVITFQCEADYMMFGQPEIHCNGVRWSSAPPRCEAITDLMECDFEHDLCGWTQNHTVFGNQNWTRHMGATPTGGTGPKRDHTYPNLDTGHYMYFESSSPTEEGDQAILVSPPYTADLSPMCFEFWYHMLGPKDHGHVGSLAVYVKSESEAFGMLQPSFYKEGNQGDVWQMGDIFIDEMLESYQIIIQATKKKSYMSDVAIDDVRLYNCTQTTTSSTTSTTIISTTPVTTTLSTPVYHGRGSSSSFSPASSTFVKNSSLSVQTSVSSSSRLSTNRTSMTISTTPLSKVVSSKQMETITSSHATMPSLTSNVFGMNSSLLPTKTVPASSKIVSPSLNNKTISTSMTTKISDSVSNATTTATSKASSTVKSSKIPPIITFPTTKTAVRTTAGTSKTAKPSTKQTTTIVTKPVITSSKIPITDLTTIQTETTTTKPFTTQTSTQTSSTPITEAPMTSEKEITVTSFSTAVKSSVATQSSSSSSVPSSTASSETSGSSKSPTISTSFVPSPLSTKPSLAGNTSEFSSGSSSSGSDVSTIKYNTTTVVTSLPTALTSPSRNTSISVSQQRSKHPEDETLKPLMIGLGVGIIVGLIVIGVIGWVCMRRRKFYTSRYEDELKPITNAASTQSLNNVDYYQDDFDIEHVQ